MTSIITNPQRTDGFGAQFQTIIYSVIASELTKQKYLYTPFATMEHNYDNDPHFIDKKEELINFKNNFELNIGDNSISIQKKHSATDFIKFFENNLEMCYNSKSLLFIKKIFKENKNRSKFFNSEKTNVAVHVRRSNAQDNRVDGTNTPDSVYLSIIENIRKDVNKKYPDKKLLFHIYSQGKIEDFKKIYEGDDIIFHIDESIEDTFIQLVLADILVTSRSSFSYVAGIVSEGIVYYLPFWHPPLPGWITC